MSILTSRAQRVEARIGCKILNTMTALGMPDSEMIGCWESGPSELSASIRVVHQGTVWPVLRLVPRCILVIRY